MNGTNEVEVTVTTLTLKKLMERPLAIPDYQRRYCWGRKEVGLLLEDINEQLKLLKADSEQPPLFLGTIIVHQEDNEAKKTDYLVDGQQRCLTLVLLMKALKLESNLAENKLLQAEFHDSLSQQCLNDNYHKICDYIKQPEVVLDDWQDAVLGKIQFVVITINSIDQAFAFFDSQNTSGKRLSEFDLLKARHLRAVVSDSSVGVGCSNLWEEFEVQQIDNRNSLAYFITEKLLACTRVRQRGDKTEELKLREEFPVQVLKQNRDNKGTIQLSPPTAVSHYRDWTVKYESECNNKPAVSRFELMTNIKFQGEEIAFNETDLTRLPLQIGQPLFGGEQFFLYIGKYAEMYKKHFPQDILELDTSVKSEKNEKTIHGRLLRLHRQVEQGQGVGYSRLIEVWLAMLLFYLDRFGEDELFHEFVALADQYVFVLRIIHPTLRRSTVENYFFNVGVFKALLQCPSSFHAVVLLKDLSDKESLDKRLGVSDKKKLLAKVFKVKRGIRWPYLKQFYLPDSKGGSLHKANKTELANELSEIYGWGVNSD